MAKVIIFKLSFIFHLIGVCCWNFHGFAGAASQTSEVERCIRLNGDISDQDTRLNGAINQLFKVCPAYHMLHIGRVQSLYIFFSVGEYNEQPSTISFAGRSIQDHI